LRLIAPDGFLHQVANRLSAARLAAPGSKQADWLHS
jgi:hypothetical protein